jgi:signal transduction histidine kinase
MSIARTTSRLPLSGYGPTVTLLPPGSRNWNRGLDALAVILVTAIIEALVWTGTGPGDPITGPRAIAALLPLLLAFPLWVRRRYPLAACIAVMTGLLTQALISGHAAEGLWGVVALGLAAYSVAAYNPRRHALIGLAVVVVGYGIWASQDRNIRSGRSGELWAGSFFGLYLLAVWLVGAVVRARAEGLAAAAHAAALEREADRAVVEERARIARDLHDIVSHNLSVVVVQAAGGRALADKGALDTAATLEKIESSGREALAEMRRLLGVLRTDGTIASPDPALTPTPGAADLESLVANVRGAGVVVDLIVEAGGGLPPAVDVSVFRIVQEALTNVLKHAGPRARADVRVSVADGQVTVVVIDDGCGPNAEPGLGHGLRGMRERVMLLGGELLAGGRPGGGFSVAASLPIEAQA